ncbi:MAG: enoyl-CoA hydratase/isomerase family protein [Hyphomonadaceae bacterium]
MTGGGDTEHVRLAIEGGLAIITLCRADAGNALDDQSGRALKDAALACATAREVRAVLLRAEGKHFCFGGDLAHVSRQDDPGRAVREMTQDFHAAILLFTQMAAPLVCAVRGAATGAGLSLAAAADYVIASDTAFFAYAYTSVGFSADGGLTWTLPRLIGLRAFQSLYLTNRRVPAPEALNLGIVSEMVDDAALDQRALAFARERAAGPTLAFGAVKRLAGSAFSSTLPSQLEAESDILCRLARSDDSAQAIKAMLNRRQPTFSGS